MVTFSVTFHVEFEESDHFMMVVFLKTFLLKLLIYKYHIFKARVDIKSNLELEDKISLSPLFYMCVKSIKSLLSFKAKACKTLL